MAAHLAYYEILGLDAPPLDRKAVKRAYSKMLKATRPEDDPEGFMRLRDAHDIALNIVAREAENAAWKAEQELYKAQPTEPLEKSNSEDGEELDTAEAKLTYADMIAKPESASETSYSIGPSPSLEAPLSLPEKIETQPDTSYAIGNSPSLEAPVPFSEPQVPKTPPLIEMIESLLEDAKTYNDRENWNQLFRKARQLDIDDYVDFEQLLLDKILQFHGYYYDNNPLHDTPEKMVQKLSPSIAASLFKTMNWDQVNKQGYHRGQQIEWLERRMQMRKRSSGHVPVPVENSSGMGSVWLILVVIFFIARVLLYVTGS